MKYYVLSEEQVAQIRFEAWLEHDFGGSEHIPFKAIEIPSELEEIFKWVNIGVSEDYINGYKQAVKEISTWMRDLIFKK